MSLALLIVPAVWLLAMAMVVGLCRLAQQGDATLGATPARAGRTPRTGRRRIRGAHACDAPVGAAQR